MAYLKLKEIDPHEKHFFFLNELNEREKNNFKLERRRTSLTHCDAQLCFLLHQEAPCGETCVEREKMWGAGLLYRWED